MKKSHSGFWMGIAILIVAAVYSTILFTLKKTFDISAWVIYGFTMLSFLTLIIDVCFSYSGNKRYPMLDLLAAGKAVIYFAVQFALGGVASMFFSGLPLTPVVLTEIVLLAIYLIHAVLMFAAHSSIAAQDANDHRNTQTMRLLKVDLDAVAGACEDALLRKEIASLAEDVGYSDVVSVPALREIENRIRSNVSLLREEVEDGDVEKARKRTEKIHNMLRERNAKCAALKQ